MGDQAGTKIFKITDTAALAKAEAEGEVLPSADDRRDGFIHLSTAAQLAGTLERHFQGVERLMLLAFRAGDFGDALRWEPSRGGDLFPHLYGPLPISALLWAEPLPIEADGRHLLSETLLAKIGEPL